MARPKKRLDRRAVRFIYAALIDGAILGVVLAAYMLLSIEPSPSWALGFSLVTAASLGMLALFRTRNRFFKLLLIPLVVLYIGASGLGFLALMAPTSYAWDGPWYSDTVEWFLWGLGMVVMLNGGVLPMILIQSTEYDLTFRSGEDVE